MRGHGKAGRIYELQRLAFPTGSDWSTVATSNPITADAMVETTDQEAHAASAIYRVIASVSTSTPTALELWRLDHFETSANTGMAADNSDPDHDGEPNFDEYVAGTDPNDGTDIFRILTSLHAGNSFTVSVAGKSGRIYELKRSPNLTGDSWTTVATSLLTTTNSTLEMTDPNAPSDKGFYKVIVAMPPPDYSAGPSFRISLTDGRYPPGRRGTPPFPERMKLPLFVASR